MTTVTLTPEQWKLIRYTLEQRGYDLRQKPHQELWKKSREDVARTLEDLNQQLRVEDI